MVPDGLPREYSDFLVCPGPCVLARERKSFDRQIQYGTSTRREDDTRLELPWGTDGRGHKMLVTSILMREVRFGSRE